MAIGDKLRFGTAYMGESKLRFPKRPTDSGDIPYYDRANHPDFTIRDTDEDEDFVMQWVQVTAGKTPMYICDRNVLCNFAWNDMRDYMNMIDGKTVTIDGKYYTLRSIRCGQTTYEGTTNDYSYNGGANNNTNEWDRYINNRLGRVTLPTPAIGEGDDGNGHTLSQPGSGEDDQNGAHNLFWNWGNMYTIGGDQPNASGYVPWVGYDLAANWDDDYPRDYHSFGGLRPVLILKNSSPGSPIVESPRNNIRVGSGNLEILFTPQQDPDADTLNLSVELSTSAAFAADVTQIFTNGIQRKNGNSWYSSYTVNREYAGVPYRYVIPSSYLTAPVMYIRVGAIDNSGAKEKVYSDPICVRNGTHLELLGTPPDSRGTTRPERCVLYAAAVVDAAATAHYYVCNNGLDASPAWEETTLGEVHTFTNTSKTAENWALNWKITVDAGMATGDIKIGPQVALGLI